MVPDGQNWGPPRPSSDPTDDSLLRRAVHLPHDISVGVTFRGGRGQLPVRTRLSEDA